jgi:hypothetical protein
VVTVEPPPRAGRVVVADHGDGPGDEAWDAFVAATPDGDVNQTSGWGRVKEATGNERRRVVVLVDGELVGGAQVLTRRIGPLGAVAYVPYGPVLRPGATEAQARALADGLVERCRRWRVRALFVQPPEGGERIAGALREVGLRPTSVDVAPSASLRLDLALDPDALLEQMARTPRRQIKRALRQPLTVRLGDRDDLRSFHELHASSAARQDFRPSALAHLETMWDELHPGGNLHLHLAATDGVDVAGLIVTRLGDVVTARLQGFDQDRADAGLRPNERVLWAALEHARAVGARWYDLGGLPRAEVAALAGTPERRAEVLSSSHANHKVRLGGVPVVHPEPLELIPGRLLGTAYRSVRSSTAWAAVRKQLEARFRAGSDRRSE